MMKQIHFSQRIIFCTITNLDLDQIIQQIMFVIFNRQNAKVFVGGTGMILIDLQEVCGSMYHKVLLVKVEPINF